MPSPRKDKELVEIYLVLEEIIARGCDVMPIIGYDDSHGDYRDGWWSVDEPTKVQRAKREQREYADLEGVPQGAPIEAGRDHSASTKAAANCTQAAASSDQRRAASGFASRACPSSSLFTSRR